VPVAVVPKNELTEMGWEVHPQGLRELLLRLTREYHVPELHVTENGAAFADVPDPDGRVSDPRRVDYFRRHLQELHAALERGAPVRSYYAWSLLDNWEWAHGFDRRFGLFRVDYDTQARVPKDSAWWYREVATTNEIPDGLPSIDLRRVP